MKKSIVIIIGVYIGAFAGGGYAAFMITALIMAVLMFVKNENTFKKRKIIGDAIFAYSMDCLIDGEQRVVEYTDMQSYEETMWNLFDWGYENILPPEKYQIIKQYII